MKLSFKKLATVISLSLSLALTVPVALPLATATNVATVEAAAAPSISQKSASILTGQTIKLTVANKGKKSIKWSTNKSKVATVKNGKVTALSKGTAVITAKVGNKKLKCKVTVNENVIKLDKYDVKDVYPGDIAITPTSVYYKNGNLYCKADFINRKSTKKIKKITNLKKKDQLNMSVSARVYTTPVNYTDVLLASGTIKKGLPTNIGYNTKKSFTISFSGKQIKKKGFDLNTADSISLDYDNFYYWFNK